MQLSKIKRVAAKSWQVSIEILQFVKYKDTEIVSETDITDNTTIFMVAQLDNANNAGPNLKEEAIKSEVELKVTELISLNEEGILWFKFNDSELYDVLVTKDVEKISEVVEKRIRAQFGLFEKQKIEERILKIRPDSSESQEIIMKNIWKKRQKESLERMTHDYPSLMFRVQMLFIRASINNNSLLAFIDTGAQVSLMSYKCAQRLNLIPDIDEDFSQKLVGVGTQNSLGKIHIAVLQINNESFPCSFTVVKNLEYDALIGLDVMKQHRCRIDLEENKIYFSANANTKFLSDVEIEANEELNKRKKPEE